MGQRVHRSPHPHTSPPRVRLNRPGPSTAPSEAEHPNQHEPCFNAPRNDHRPPRPDQQPSAPTPEPKISDQLPRLQYPGLIPLLITYYAPLDIETWAILGAVAIALVLTSIASARSTHVSTARTLGRSLVVGGVTLLVSYIAGELLLG